jgi:effector-binding domain-containing protein
MVDVELVDVPSETVALVRARVPVTEMPAFFGPAFEQVVKAVPEAGGRVTGPPFGWYHGVPTDVVDVSAGFPVAGDVDLPDGEVVVEERPGGRAVVAVHVGPYDTIEATYGLVMAWIGEHSLEPREDMWEEYLSEPTGDPANWRTRVVIPVR